jgi:hypothetical protein
MMCTDHQDVASRCEEKGHSERTRHFEREQDELDFLEEFFDINLGVV